MRLTSDWGLVAKGSESAACGGRHRRRVKVIVISEGRNYILSRVRACRIIAAAAMSVATVAAVAVVAAVAAVLTSVELII